MSGDLDFADLIAAIEKRIDSSDLVTWHSAVRTAGGAVIVLYRKVGDSHLYGQLFDQSFFDGFGDQSAEALAAIIVANELEPPHDGGDRRRPASVESSLLPEELIHWVAI